MGSTGKLKARKITKNLTKTPLPTLPPGKQALIHSWLPLHFTLTVFLYPGYPAGISNNVGPTCKLFSAAKTSQESYIFGGNNSLKSLFIMYRSMMCRLKCELQPVSLLTNVLKNLTQSTSCQLYKMFSILDKIVVFLCFI